MYISYINLSHPTDLLSISWGFERLAASLPAGQVEPPIRRRVVVGEADGFHQRRQLFEGAFGLVGDNLREIPGLSGTLQ